MKGAGSRARMHATLARQGKGFLVLDLGSSPNTTMSRVAHDRLLQYLGLPAQPDPDLMSLSFLAVHVREEALEALHIDTRSVVPRAVMPPVAPNGTYTDDWGITYRPTTIGGQILYYEMVTHPLSRATGPRDLATHAWPQTPDTATWEALGLRAAALAQDTEYAVVGHPGDTSLFEVGIALLGMQRFMMALVREKELVHALLHHILDVQMRRMEGFLAHVGQYLDVLCVGDDLGQQTGLLISPDLYRQIVKPYHKQLFAAIKSKTRARLHFHSCGGIAPLIPDLVEIGIDVINPVQITARGMSPADLAQRYGDRVAFWGGVDTQSLLRSGSPADVRRQVRELASTLGKQGGYVVGAVHNIQADVPPENIVALYDEAWRISKG